MLVKPTKTDLMRLQRHNQPYSVSIYMSLETHSGTQAENTNRIKIKNVFSQIASILKNQGLDKKTIDQTLKPAQKLMSHPGVLHEGGVAMFMSPTSFYAFKLPSQSTQVSDFSIKNTFDTLLLEQVVSSDKNYYLLTLSHNGVRLFQGDQFKLQPVRNVELWESVKDSLEIDELSAVLETHSVATPSKNRRSEAFHGHYDAKKVDKDLLLKFFRKVDNKLHSFLRGKKTPIVIAGVDYLHPIYHKANTSQMVLPTGLIGNYDRSETSDLHKKSWKLVSEQV